MTAGKALTVRRWAHRDSKPHVRPEPSPNGHVHRWRLEEPNGPEARGECRICGSERMFLNSIPDLDYFDGRLS